MASDHASTTSKRRFRPSLWMARLFTFILPVLVIVGGVFSVVVMGGMRPDPEQREEAATPPAVLTAEAETSSVNLTVGSQGEVRPRTEIDVVPQVGGRVVMVSEDFVEGGFFSEGDVLIEIDDADYQLAITRAESQVAQASRALQRERAEADIAAGDWRDLGVGDPSALALRQPQLAEARAALRAAEASLATARLDLERTVVRAPFDGRVASISANLGQYVTPGQPLGEIFSTEMVEVSLALSDADLTRAGLPVAFRETEDNPGPNVRLSATVGGEQRVWNGRITRTASRFDSSTRLLAAITQVDDPYGAGADGGVPLAVGLFVSAQIEGRRIDEAVTLPRTALRNDQDVYVIRDDNQIEIRQVAVIDSDRERVVLASGVEPGERVVVSPLRGAVNGMIVAPVSNDASENAGDELVELASQ